MYLNKIQKKKRIIIIILSAIVALAIMIGIGFMIYGGIRTRTLDRQNLYLTAHQITDQNQFEHLLATAGGRTIVEGNIQATKGITHTYISGEHFGIQVRQERYTMETYTVTHTDSNGNTRVETRTRWVWRYRGTTRNVTNDYTFMNQDLNANITFNNWQRINLNEYNVSGQRVRGNRLYSTNMNREGTIRSEISIIPMSFNGAMFIDIHPDKIISGIGGSEIRFHANRSVEDVLASGVADRTWIFFMFWIPLSIGAIVLVIFLKRRVWFG